MNGGYEGEAVKYSSCVFGSSVSQSSTYVPSGAFTFTLGTVSSQIGWWRAKIQLSKVCNTGTGRQMSVNIPAGSKYIGAYLKILFNTSYRFETTMVFTSTTSIYYMTRKQMYNGTQTGDDGSTMGFSNVNRATSVTSSPSQLNSYIIGDYLYYEDIYNLTASSSNWITGYSNQSLGTLQVAFI